jgi:hypothetical protein
MCRISLDGLRGRHLLRCDRRKFQVWLAEAAPQSVVQLGDSFDSIVRYHHEN